MNVNLKLIHTFLVVAESGSFRGAAETLNRSQSAISMQIRQLERQIGASLFHRGTRRISLTKEGELLLACARRSVMELQTGLRQIKEAAEAQQVRVTLACSPIAAPRLPPILAAFQRRYPGIATGVHELVDAEVLDSVRRHDVDFGIAPLGSDSAELDFQSVLLDEICALIPRDMEAASCRSISPIELGRLPMLALSIPPQSRCKVHDELKAHGVTLDIKYEVRDSS